MRKFINFRNLNFAFLSISDHAHLILPIKGSGDLIWTGFPVSNDLRIHYID